ncbi:unnamed protein product [Rotaria sordida]|uniref:Uncharacterized protein n=1 Tax=Rotaria sordida TaxID=392033 RepID=A0A815GMK7_9BILA|nr:unnamed protein product [Rotaria sordida]
MSKYNSIISRAVNIVAQKLAGMNPDIITRFTKILSEEARIIYEELLYSGQNVDVDILAARLDGILKRMKYELRNKGPDLSPYEFPIFNVSYNPYEPNPKPINHLYNKHYKKVSSNFIEPNQRTYPTSQQNFESIQTTHPNSSLYQIYQQQQPIIDWHSLQSPITYYQKPITSIDKSSTIYRSSTGDNIHSRSLSRSTSDSELNYSVHSNFQTHQTSTKSNHKSNTNEKKLITTKRIYTSPNTVIGSQTIKDLFQVINNEKSTPSPSTSTTTRVIIIDRYDPNSSNNNQSKNKKELLNTSTSKTSTTVSTRPSTDYVMQQSTYYNPRQPVMYTSMPNNIYSTRASYVTNTSGYYPLVYYR